MADIDELLEEAPPRDCVCGCHTRHPGRPAPSLHDGGVSCPCRLSPEERQRLFDHSMSVMQEWWDSPEFKAMKAADDADDTAAAEWGERNGIEFQHISRMAPNQIEGALEVGGEKVPFYFRERHGSWTVRVPNVMGEVVGAGSEDEYTDTTGALRLVREAILKHHLRECTHTARGEALFCPGCGKVAER